MGAAVLAMVARVSAEEAAEKTEEAPAEAAAAPEKKNWLPGGLSGNVALYTDYSFRGVSQNNRRLALQGGLDWVHDSGIHVGTWGSTVDFGDAYLEQDFYGGYAGAIGDFSYDFISTFFFYPDDERFNYWEFAVNAGYDFKVAKWSVGFVGSPDYFGTLGTGYYGSTGVAVPIPIPTDYFGLTFDTKLGYTATQNPIFASDSDYWDWQAGLVFGLPFNLALDFRYVGTDLNEDFVGSDDAASRFIFGAKYSF